MSENSRISSIATMGGLIILSILFLNDLHTPGVMTLTGISASYFFGMGLADWIFPAFLFVIGMAIPFSLNKIFSEGKDTFSVAKHIIGKSISLLVIGVLMLNSQRVDPDITGMSKYIWTMFMYVGIFLVWNRYTENDKNFFTVSALKLVGLTILIALVLKFGSGKMENNGSLITSSWGVLGIIGWGYLISAFVYLAVRNSILNTVVALLFFVALNILSSLNLLSSLNIAKPIIGVLIEGSVPVFMLSGLLATIILEKYSKDNYLKGILTLISISVISVLAGIVLQIFISGAGPQSVFATPLVYSGICMIFYVIFYYLIEIKNEVNLSSFLQSTGKNAYTVFLVSYFMYNLIWLTGVPAFFYKQEAISIGYLTGSAIFTLLVVAISVLLGKLNIRLKI
jgi:heparan-alpha-glucosaminide N-acetyltransferase